MLFRLADIPIVVHKVIHFSGDPHQDFFILPCILAGIDTAKSSGFAQHIHLAQFCMAAVVGTPKRHKHFQRERCTAGNPHLQQAEYAIGAAHKECHRKQRIQGKAALEKVCCTLDQLGTAQKARNQHCQELTEDHQPHTVFRDQSLGMCHGGNRTEDHHQQAEKHTQLQLS